MELLKQKLHSKIKDVLALNEWIFETKFEDVEVFTQKPKNEGPLIVKGVGVVNLPSQKIHDIIQSEDTQVRSKWEPLIESTQNYEIIEEFNFSHLKFQSPSYFVTKRDFCLYGTSFKEKEKTTIMNISVPSDSSHYKSEEKGYVRGRCLIGYWELLSLTENQTMVTAITQGEFSGWVPDQLSRSVRIEQPKTILKFRNF